MEIGISMTNDKDIDEMRNPFFFFSFFFSINEFDVNYLAIVGSHTV